MPVFQPDCLSDEVALVTGASRGIGRAIADQLARAGATVIGTATSQAGADGITQRLAELGARGRGAVLDVVNAPAGEALIEAVAKEYGKLSILVNNAGITRDTLAMRMKDDGRIINITSVVGASGNAGQVNYAAAKAGVAGMTRALARELGSRNITVNCVAPGFIDTDMTRGLNEAQTQGLLGQIPLGRLGQADEVASAVVFLASAAGSYVSGATLHVNGGMFMN
jgi:3-oxoacyl-[acyl-carrier protein] reductase